MKFTLLFVLIFSATTFAKNYPWKGPMSWATYMSKKEFEAKKQYYKENAARKIANASELEASAEFTKFSNEFLNLKTSDDVWNFITKVEKEYDSYPVDVKVAALLTLRLKPFRAIIYRMDNLAEKSNVAHTKQMSQLKNVFSGLEIYFPEDHASALFKYFTEPYPGVAYQFETIDQLQSFMVSDIYPTKLQAIRNIEALDFSKPIVWDNRLVYGSDSFIDGIERFKVVGEAEKFMMVSKLHRGAHNILHFTAYSFPTKDFFKMVNKTTNLYGFDSIRKNGDGVSEQDKIEIINKFGAGKFVLKADGQEYSKAAFVHLKQSIYSAGLAWQIIQKSGHSDYDLINVAGMQTNTRELNLNYEIISQMMEGKTQISSKIEKDNVVTVNLPAHYEHPVKDLTQLLPNKFEQGPKYLTFEEKKGKKMVTKKYLNYSKGRAVAWDAKAYQHIFPEMKNGEELPKFKRALSQSYGGWVVTSPLNMFIK